MSLLDYSLRGARAGTGYLDQKQVGSRREAKYRDPLGLQKGFKSKKPKKPEKTAEQDALERRTRSLLDKEIGKTEDKLRAQVRGRLGSRSLLTGAPTTANQASSGIKQNKQGGTVSMLGGGR